MSNEDQTKKSFEQLVEEKASCLEFALNGYVRIYEAGEKRCECKDCKALPINNYIKRVPTNKKFNLSS